MSIIICLTDVRLFYVVLECPLNRFGHDCTYECHCKDGAHCQPVTGLCSNGCAPWYVGTDAATCHIYTGKIYLYI